MELSIDDNISRNIKVCWVTIGQLMSTSVMYAGLIVCATLVSSVLCDTVDSRYLTYDHIYNSTSYAQLEHHLTPYHKVAHKKNSSQRYTPLRGDEYRFKDKYEISSQGQLLVGFARDPFRQSIPEVDYRQGVRSPEQQAASAADRGKRGVVHLYNMLTCATGCDPLAYKGYGCYCGLLGEGRPTDGIDNCCRIHDECYDKFHCPFYTVYFQPYYWKCYHGEPLCAVENHLARKGVNSCAGQLCECDRRFAMCVRRYSCPRGKALCRSSPLRLLQNILMSYR